MFLLGIDIGTSACKVAVFDEEGQVVAQGNGRYEVYYPSPGLAEQNPEHWWNVVCETTRQVLEGVDEGDIAAVGIDGQSWSAIAIDKDGKVLTNTPIWMDTRAEDICAHWESTIGSDEIFKLCGNPIKPMYTTPKIGWYKKHLPSVYNQTFKILQSNSFIAYRLTGVLSQDKSQGYGLHCFDMEKTKWDLEMCRALGINPELLPDIYDCHQVIGTVTKEAAALTGLPAGTPVVAGGLDAACGTLGAGVINDGETQEQGGRAGGMSICLEKMKADIRLILSPHVVPERWLLQGGSVGGGGVMHWVEEVLGELEAHLRTEGTAEKVNSLKLLDSRASSVPAGSDGLIFLPYMAGERSPIWDTNAKGVLFGLDYSKTKGHIIRACLEGVAYSLKHNLDTAQEAGASVNELRAMGGAANSRLWTQIKADVTGKVIRVPLTDAATTLGAAILAGVGVGVYKSFDEAVKKTVAITREHRPDPSKHQVYAKHYQTYLKLYQQLKTLMSETGGKA